jgi:hypothetical protein
MQKPKERSICGVLTVWTPTVQYSPPWGTSGNWPRPAFLETSRWPVPSNSSLPQAISFKYVCPLLVDTCYLHPLGDWYANEYFYNKMLWEPTNWSIISVCHDSWDCQTEKWRLSIQTFMSSSTPRYEKFPLILLNFTCQHSAITLNVKHWNTKDINVQTMEQDVVIR